ncbi:hypothetical protein ABC347_08350 [Sphingomonas sp. 1P06PA]|uniref:hypothetical protein n=1 Tax=Sphingomonas sp. 1P06PA TaxID=554121 RepID=UPI0039A5ED4B
MGWGGPGFVLAIIALSMGSWVLTTWIRARHGYALEDEWSGKTYKSDGPDAGRKFELLGSENEKLRQQVIRLEERIAVLERIATDSSVRLSKEIDSLR